MAPVYGNLNLKCCRISKGNYLVYASICPLYSVLVVTLFSVFLKGSKLKYLISSRIGSIKEAMDKSLRDGLSLTCGYFYRTYFVQVLDAVAFPIHHPLHYLIPFFLFIPVSISSFQFILIKTFIPAIHTPLPIHFSPSIHLHPQIHPNDSIHFYPLSFYSLLSFD